VQKMSDELDEEMPFRLQKERKKKLRDPAAEALAGEF